MTVTADDVAALVQKHFDELPAKRKPIVRGNGLREWVPLAGIVAEDKDGELKCLSLATGMKCLPASKVPQANGNVLHDWHAEVLAIRAFNRFVLDECKALAEGGSSEFLHWRTRDEIASGSHADPHGGNWNGQPFTWREDIQLHMYCSEAPCGDASMELIMALQDDATPWDLPPTTLNSSTPMNPTTISPTSLPGRAYFSQLGVTRRKPGRSDAPSTLSKSCSDKLAQRQCVSLLSSTTALLVDPQNVYLRTLVLPASRYVEGACQRAFSAAGRMGGLDSYLDPGAASLGEGHRNRKEEDSSEGLQGSWDIDSSYAFRPFAVETTSSEFIFSQRSVTLAATAAESSTPEKSDKQERNKQVIVSVAPSNLAAAWTRSGLSESTLGGVLQGRKASLADARGASFASRRRMWELAVEVANLLGSRGRALEPGEENEEGRRYIAGEVKAGVTNTNPAFAEIQRALGANTYGDMKKCTLLEPRRRAKDKVRAEALKGWVRNLGDESFTL